LLDDPMLRIGSLLQTLFASIEKIHKDRSLADSSEI
jgi:hypothetical protein